MTIEQDKIFRLACDISDGTVSAIDGSHTIHQLIREARIEELKTFVGILNDIDPYQPLDGTPRDYVNGKFNDRIEQLNRSKAE